MSRYRCAEDLSREWGSMWDWDWMERSDWPTIACHLIKSDCAVLQLFNFLTKWTQTSSFLSCHPELIKSSELILWCIPKIQGHQKTHQLTTHNHNNTIVVQICVTSDSSTQLDCASFTQHIEKVQCCFSVESQELVKTFLATHLLSCCHISMFHMHGCSMCPDDDCLCCIFHFAVPPPMGFKREHNQLSQKKRNVGEVKQKEKERLAKIVCVCVCVCVCVDLAMLAWGNVDPQTVATCCNVVLKTFSC